MLVYDRNPESVRTVSRVFAAGRDSVSAASAEIPESMVLNRGGFADAPPKIDQIQNLVYKKLIPVSPKIIFSILNPAPNIVKVSTNARP